MVKKKLVLDSDVIVDVLRTGGGLIEQVTKEAVAGKAEIYVSSVTVLELWAGESAVKQVELIESILNNLLVIPVDHQLARYVGEMKRNRKLQLQLADLIIGATAVWIKGELVTKNKKDFSQVPGIKFWKGDRILE